ncbi:MAG: hypothetical protein KME26_33285 [Oscillatoria princeps RMCB-10]|nr:hypothetical protein [Oscillatoria princeps RMCB-10]
MNPPLSDNSDGSGHDIIAFRTGAESLRHSSLDFPHKCFALTARARWSGLFGLGTPAALREAALPLGKALRQKASVPRYAGLILNSSSFKLASHLKVSYT